MSITDLAVKNPFSSPFLAENKMVKENPRKIAFAAADGGKFSRIFNYFNYYNKN